MSTFSPRFLVTVLAGGAVVLAGTFAWAYDYDSIALATVLEDHVELIEEAPIEDTPEVIGQVVHTDVWSAPAAGAEPIPALASRPGAAVTVYLDFTGARVSAPSRWHAEGWRAGEDPENPRADLVWSSVIDETGPRITREAITALWGQVVEDFAGYDINITTVPPSAEAFYKRSPEDPTTGIHMVITSREGLPVNEQAPHPGGMGLLGTIREYGQAQRAVGISAFAVMDTDVTVDNTAQLGNIVSHELGHVFGLAHARFHHNYGTDQHTTIEYWHGTAYWNSLMGVSASSGILTAFDDGSFTGADRKYYSLAERVEGILAPVHTSPSAVVLDASTPSTQGILTGQTDDITVHATSDALLRVRTLDAPNVLVAITVEDIHTHRTWQATSTVDTTEGRRTYRPAEVTIPAGDYRVRISGVGAIFDGDDYPVDNSRGHYQLHLHTTP